MACITVGSPSGPVEDFLEEWTLERLEEISPSVVPEATKVFVNGRWVGVHRAPAELVRTLRALRRQVRERKKEVSFRLIVVDSLVLFSRRGGLSALCGVRVS
jgi:DNA-directed RNA polymerase beta subunit